MEVEKSGDASMGAVKGDSDLPVPCSELTSGPDMAPETVQDKGGDTTESSSSFGDTFSGFDDEAEVGEPEVSSSHALASADGEGASVPPRRKKVTAEWRNTIRPIIWRCQWLELRMKDLSSQISRYDRELALIEKEKGLQKAVSKENGSVPDAMQIGKDHRNSIMKRKERKRPEDTADTSLYIKKHQILSYYNDKQNKGAEADGHLIDDNCGGTVDGGITGGLDTVALLDAEEYDTIYEQVALKDILSTIDGVQSQVQLLRDRLNKAHLEEDNLALSEDNTHFRVPRKRKSTQKFCDTTYMEYQNAKPQKYRSARLQKRKNLNILLQDDDGPKPVSSDRGTECKIEDTKGNSLGQNGEWNCSGDRAITMDLLLGVDNSLPNGHIGDLCKENADDILIDNRRANEDSPQFEKMEYLPSESSSKGHNAVALEEVKASAPVKVDVVTSPLKVDSTSATMVNQEPLLEKVPMLKPVKKRDWKPKERNIGWGSASSSMNHSKGAAATSDSEQKSNGTPPSAKEKTESIPTAPVDPEIMTPLAALKKRKAGNRSASSEEHKAGSLASKKHKTGTSAGNKSAGEEEHKSGDLAAKNEKSGNSSPPAKKQVSSPAAKPQETESTPSKLMVEKAVLVAVNSRRSQRIRKPKVY